MLIGSITAGSLDNVSGRDLKAWRKSPTLFSPTSGATRINSISSVSDPPIHAGATSGQSIIRAHIPVKSAKVLSFAPVMEYPYELATASSSIR